VLISINLHLLSWDDGNGLQNFRMIFSPGGVVTDVVGHADGQFVNIATMFISLLTESGMLHYFHLIQNQN